MKAFKHLSTVCDANRYAFVINLNIIAFNILYPFTGNDITLVYPDKKIGRQGFLEGLHFFIYDQLPGIGNHLHIVTDRFNIAYAFKIHLMELLI